METLVLAVGLFFIVRNLRIIALVLAERLDNLTRVLEAGLDAIQHNTKV